MQLPIRKKIMLGLGVIITLMIISNAVVIVQLNEVSSSAKTTLTTDVAAIDIVKQLQMVLVDQERNAQKFLVSHDGTYFGLFSDGTRQFDSFMDSLLIVRPKLEEMEVIHEIRQSHAWFVNVIGREAGEADTNLHGADSLMKAISDSLGIVHVKFDWVIRLNQLAISSAMTTVETTTGRSLGIAFILTLGTLALAIGLSVFIAWTITRPIEGLIIGTEKIARGSFEPMRFVER
ncbi:MAG: hypothetical protein HYR76_09860 [Ignavibacteria bacterium]|nr:hypothetical protein [Ignavibacteria bacterium]